MLFYDNVGYSGGKIFLTDLLSYPIEFIYDCGFYELILKDCSSTSGDDIVWTFSKLPGPRITVQCDEVTVADITLSNTECGNSFWTSWNGVLSKIKIVTTNAASYRSKPGNMLTCNVSFTLSKPSKY